MITRLIFGGSFNPIHKGHLETIEYVLKNSICLEIFLIPNYQSPFKKEEEYAPAELRLEMIQYSLRSYFIDEFLNKIKILDIELKQKKISYTIETLQAIQDLVKTGILIGSDTLTSLYLWKEIEWILTYYPFYVIRRNEISKNIVLKEIERIKSFYPSANFHLIDFSPKACKAKEIREKIKFGCDYSVLKDCITPEVFSIIKKNKLYM